MIDLKDLRETPDKYRKGAADKNVRVDIDAILDFDLRHRAAQQEFERLRAEQNAASQSIGKLKDPEEKKLAVARVGTLKASVKDAEERARQLETDLQALLLLVPQPADLDVPVGRDASENVVVSKWGEPKKFNFKTQNHIELAQKLKIVDFEAGVKLGGSRSYMLLGAGAELHMAVIRLALDIMVRENGFTQVTVPVLVREEAMQGTGFFPTGREQAYHVSEDNLFLTGTAEVGLTAMHAGQTLEESQLPLRYVAVSTCFRREAGTYGKDTAGLYRVHLFDKVEQVVIARNDIEESKLWHRKMLGFAETLLQRLELPYRIIQCCTGDIGVKNASMLDIETWMPSRFDGKDPATGYGETHSASRLYEFQSRRLNLRYKGADGKVRYCHTLNNTVVASPRILIPIIENYQNEDGSVTVPEALRGYMGGRETIS
ncbi:MAG: serine--tRNA ligase [Burkholderiales bacterium]|nr:serine--tRNA ligase [Phycisphaerae bacterium]